MNYCISHLLKIQFSISLKSNEIYILKRMHIEYVYTLYILIMVPSRNEFYNWFHFKHFCYYFLQRVYYCFQNQKKIHFLSDVKLKLSIQHPNGCTLWRSPREIHYPNVTANFSSSPLVNKPPWLPLLRSTQFSTWWYDALCAIWGFLLSMHVCQYYWIQ